MTLGFPEPSAPSMERDPLARSAFTNSPFARPGTGAPRLPSLPATGEKVDVQACVEPRTTTALVVGAVIAVALSILLILSITGAVIGLALVIVDFFAVRRARVILEASSLRVGAKQFPQIHECVTAYAQRLSLSDLPEVYVVDAAEVNGFALKLGRRSGIFLTDETVAGCLEGQSPGALSFVIAHELAHLALGHHSWWRRPLRRLRWLSRLDECSADSVACELVGTREAAEDGILLLAAGPRLLSFVDRAAARTQAGEVALDRKARRVERTLTHPLTMNRLARVNKRFGTAKLRRAA